MSESSNLKYIFHPSKDSAYSESLKSLDTEEHIDLAFYRPIGYAWARLAQYLGIKPNAITIASIFLGVGAGVAFYFNNIWINLLGILLLVWANSFDSTDGQLARMTRQYSRLGRILDGLSGDFWFAAIYIAICLRENVTSDFFMERPWLIWTIAVVTGICHAVQASMADYYRQFHLFFLKGKDGSELDSSRELRERLASMSWKRNFMAKLTLTFYTRYTESQERRTPAMQALRRQLRAEFGNTTAPEKFRTEFRRLSLPLMKYANILSFNWRSIALFTAIIAGMPWLYFAFELVVLNILLIYMVNRHENICRRLTADLRAGYFKK